MKNLGFGLVCHLLFLLSGVAAAQEPRPLILYANVLGGSGQESSVLATTDAAGNVYLAGATTSPDFPASVRISNSTNFLRVSLFVVKIDPSGASLLFSTIIGGAVPGAIALDAGGSVYVAGMEAAADYPTTAGAYSATGNCFVSELDPAGAQLVYSTRLASANAASISAIAIDSTGNAYLTGSTSGGNDGFVTTPGAYRTKGFGAFALKLNPAGSGLVYSTFLPATNSMSSVSPNAIAIDAAGAAYIAGSADIQGFQPTPDTLPHEQPSGNGTTTADAMVLKLSPDGSAIVFASLFGGTGSDVASAVAVGSDGSVYVSGVSQWTTGFGPTLAFPTTPRAADTVTGFPKGFLARLTPGGDAFLFSTLLSSTASAPCLSVSDTGIDVLGTLLLRQYTPNVAGTQIMRVSPDGTTLVHSSIASFGNSAGCGQSRGNFVVLGSTEETGSTVTSPNLSHIGSRANVSFSLIAVDDPGAPRFDVNTGEINLIGWRGPNETYAPVRQVIHATTDGRAVAVGVSFFGVNDAVTMDQPVTTTPADITVVASLGSYNGQVVLFAPGTTDGLVVAPLSMASNSILFTLDPKFLQFNAENEASQLAPAVVHVSTGVVDDVFGTILPLSINYSVDSASSYGNSSSSLPLPSWLSVASTGTTPEDVTFTANPAGLADGSRSALVRFTGTGPEPPPGVLNALDAPMGYLDVSLNVGPVPVWPAPVTMTLTPQTFTLRLTDPSQQQLSAAVHLATSADPVNFSIGQLPTWLTASPSTGQTPADVRFTATPPGGNGAYAASPYIDFPGVGSGYVQAYFDVALPGYVGQLNVQPIANSFPPVSRGIAPGSLFYIQLNHPELIPDETEPAGVAVSSLAGYSFTANGAPVALIAYQPGRFLAQMPVDAKAGNIAVDAFTELTRQEGRLPRPVARPSSWTGVRRNSGTPVATVNTVVSAVGPDFVADQFEPRAQKADGTTIDATNPVAPGDAVLVHATGLGPLNPPLATGQTAAAETPSTPVAAVTATIGGKNARVISAQASASSPGVVDVWLATPNLYDGDHYISVGAMGVFTSTRIPIKVKNP